MTPLYIQLGVIAALAIGLGGVIARRRASECWMFPVYMGVVLVCEGPKFLGLITRIDVLNFLRRKLR